MRAALESDYVSANLNAWIDLIFGSRQSGMEAKMADNIFYPLTYEENINWSEYQSPYERAAMETQVAEFGQTPIKLFHNPHPTKKTRIMVLSLQKGDFEEQSPHMQQALLNTYQKEVPTNCPASLHNPRQLPRHAAVAARIVHTHPPFLPHPLTRSRLTVFAPPSTKWPISRQLERVSSVMIQQQ